MTYTTGRVRYRLNRGHVTAHAPMTDIVDSRRRSEIMSRIGPRDTAPEMAVRRAAHRMGFRFRLHRRDLPGRPDLVFPKLGLAMFVHGCFWHRHPNCQNCTAPKTRPEFWQRKFAGNVERDGRNLRDLVRLGWRVAVVWECETEDPKRLQRRLVAALSPASGRTRMAGQG